MQRYATVSGIAIYSIYCVNINILPGCSPDQTGASLRLTLRQYGLDLHWKSIIKYRNGEWGEGSTYILCNCTGTPKMNYCTPLGVQVVLQEMTSFMQLGVPQDCPQPRLLIIDCPTMHDVSICTFTFYTTLALILFLDAYEVMGSRPHGCSATSFRYYWIIARPVLIVILIVILWQRWKRSGHSCLLLRALPQERTNHAA